MLYNELIAEVIKRAENIKLRSDKTDPSFQEKLAIFFDTLEEDIYISYAGLNPTMTEEKLADAEFEKKLDEELKNAAVWKGSWVD